jgi:hypothetical protein
MLYNNKGHLVVDHEASVCICECGNGHINSIRGMRGAEKYPYTMTLFTAMRKILIFIATLIVANVINASELTTWFSFGVANTELSGSYVSTMEDNSLDTKVENTTGFQIGVHLNREWANNIFIGATMRIIEKGWRIETDGYIEPIDNIYGESIFTIGYSLSHEDLRVNFRPYIGLGISEQLKSSTLSSKQFATDFPMVVGIDFFFPNSLIIGFQNCFGTQNMIKNEKVKQNTSIVFIGRSF